jgi:ribosome-binding factor A
MVKTARKMLGEIVKIQMSGDFSKAEKYVKDNFVWTKEMEIVAQKLKKISKRLNGTTEHKLADKLFEEKID